MGDFGIFSKESKIYPTRVASLDHVPDGDFRHLLATFNNPGRAHWHYGCAQNSWYISVIFQFDGNVILTKNQVSNLKRPKRQLILHVFTIGFTKILAEKLKAAKQNHVYSF